MIKDDEPGMIEVELPEPEVPSLEPPPGLLPVTSPPPPVEVLHARADGSFVVQRNGFPYHVTADDPLFGAVRAAAENAVTVGHVFDPEPEPFTLAPARVMRVGPAAGRIILRRMGLRGQVEDLVKAQGGELQDWWEYATTWERESEHIRGMAVALGLTDQQVDDLFDAADAIVA